MTAKRFEEYCTDAGLQCVLQEVIDFYPEFSLRWGRPGRRLQRVRRKIVIATEEFSMIAFQFLLANDRNGDRRNKVLTNKRFMEEVRYLSALSQLYDGSSFKPEPA